MLVFFPWNDRILICYLYKELLFISIYFCIFILIIVYIFSIENRLYITLIFGILYFNAILFKVYPYCYFVAYKMAVWWRDGHCKYFHAPVIHNFVTLLYSYFILSLLLCKSSHKYTYKCWGRFVATAKALTHDLGPKSRYICMYVSDCFCIFSICILIW